MSAAEMPCQSDGVTAVSEFLRRKTVEVFRPQRAIQVIPNFVDTSRYAPRDPGKSRRERFASMAKKSRRLVRC